MFFTFLQLSIRNLLHRKIRSVLTVFGIIIGITVIVTLIMLSDGLQKAVESQMGQFGADLVFMAPGDMSDPITALSIPQTFRKEHAEAVEDLDNVDFVMPLVVGDVMRVEYEGQEKNIGVQAQPWNRYEEVLAKSQGFKIEEGSWPTVEDSREVLVGNSLAEKLFGEQLYVGDHLIVKGRRFEIVGILEKQGNQSQDNGIYMSMDMYEHLTGKRDNIFRMIAKVEHGEDPAVVAEDIKRVLDDQKGLEEFSVLTSEGAIEVANNVIGMLELFLFLIASVAVIVGGVGIMNTMYTTVLERTRDIGIMKSIGANNYQILMLFVVESGLIGLLGGFLGLVCGSAMAFYISFYAAQQGFRLLEVSPDPIFLTTTLVLTVIVGSMAGSLPARKAMRYLPAEALRHK